MNRQFPIVLELCNLGFMFWDPEEKKESEIKYVVTSQNSKQLQWIQKKAAITNSPNNLSF